MPDLSYSRFRFYYQERKRNVLFGMAGVTLMAMVSMSLALVRIGGVLRSVVLLSGTVR